MDRLGALSLLVVGCAPLEDPLADLERASIIMEATAHTGEGTHDATRAINGVRGAGPAAGSLDVFTVGGRPGDALVLGFRGRAVDVPGDDLAVFENPFDVDGGGRFMDPAVVEVSPDCEAFVPLPHAGPAEWSDDPDTWRGFAGVQPVLVHAEDHDVDPLGPDAGGDRFDLAALDPADPVAAEVLEAGAACVRISSATPWGFPAHPLSDGPDVDGVYAARVVP